MLDDFYFEQEKQLREFVQQKYSKAYISAIIKLNTPDCYDSKGMIKPEFVLTEQEKEALIFYIPEVSEIIAPTEKANQTFKH